MLKKLLKDGLADFDVVINIYDLLSVFLFHSLTRFLDLLLPKASN